MQQLKVLLVNPPIYDFTAYDFWLRPYGMLRVAGRIQHACRLNFFDFLVCKKRDAWGRGRFEGEAIRKPKLLSDIPRRFSRFGRPRSEFRNFLRTGRVECLKGAGAGSVITYIIAGHPDSEGQDLELSIRFANRCGTRVLLSEFSPIPGTPDGLKSVQWADLGEPLSHNKTAFAIRRLGIEQVNKVKELTRSLNSKL